MLWKQGVVGQQADAVIAGTASVELLAARLRAFSLRDSTTSAANSSSPGPSAPRHASPAKRAEAGCCTSAPTSPLRGCTTHKQNKACSFSPEQLLRAARCQNSASQSCDVIDAQQEAQPRTSDSSAFPQPQAYPGVQPRPQTVQHDNRPGYRQVDQQRLQLAKQCAKQQVQQSGVPAPSATKISTAQIFRKSSSPAAAGGSYRSSANRASAQTPSKATHIKKAAIEEDHAARPATAGVQAIAEKPECSVVSPSCEPACGHDTSIHRPSAAADVAATVSHKSPMRSTPPNQSGCGKQQSLQPQQQQHKVQSRAKEQVSGQPVLAQAAQQGEQQQQQQQQGGFRWQHQPLSPHAQRVLQLGLRIQQHQQHPQHQQQVLQLSSHQPGLLCGVGAGAIGGHISSTGHAEQASCMPCIPTLTGHVQGPLQRVVGTDAEDEPSRLQPCKLTFRHQQQEVPQQGKQPAQQQSKVHQAVLHQQVQQQMGSQQQEEQQLREQSVLDSLHEQRARVAAACAQQQHQYPNAAAVAVRAHKSQSVPGCQELVVVHQSVEPQQLQQEAVVTRQSNQQHPPVQKHAAAAGNTTETSPLERQRLLMAMLCAKHRLPLPQQASRQQQQQQQQHRAKVEAQQQQLPGRQMHARRHELLQQLQSGDITDRCNEPHPLDITEQQCQCMEAVTAVSARSSMGKTRARSRSRSPLKQGSSSNCDNSRRPHMPGQSPLTLPTSPLKAANNDITSMPSAASDSQLVHELPGFKDPSSEGISAAAAATAAAAGEGEARAMVLAEAAPAGDQQKSKAEQACQAALAQLHAAVAAATAAADDTADTPGTKHGMQEQQQEQLLAVPLPVAHALTLWGLGPATPVTSTAADHCEAVDDASPSLHELVQLYTAAVPTKQHSQVQDVQCQQEQLHHQQQQQQQQQQGFRCHSLDLLLLHALVAICNERCRWLLQQQTSTWQCLMQVRRILWHQQALLHHKHSSSRANGAASPKKPPFTAASATAGSNSSNKYLGWYRRKQQQQQQQGNSPLPASAVGVTRPAAASAGVVTRKLSSVTAVVCGSVDVTGVLIGWEGSELAVKLLTDLCRKLWCMLSLQVMKGAAVVASDLEVLLQHKQGPALQLLHTSAAFATWQQQAAAAVSMRSTYQTARQAVRSLRLQQVLQAWHAAARFATADRAALQVLQQQRRSLQLVQCFRSWRCILAQQQYRAAQNALAVLWHARIVCTRVLFTWAAGAQRAAVIKAAANGGSSSTALFHGCSISLAAPKQQQWKASVLAAVAAAGGKLAAADVAAAAAAEDLRARLPPAAVAAANLQQLWQQERQKSAQLNVQLLAQEHKQQQQVSLLPVEEPSQCSTDSLSIVLSRSIKHTQHSGIANNQLLGEQGRRALPQGATETAASLNDTDPRACPALGSGYQVFEEGSGELHTRTTAGHPTKASHQQQQLLQNYATRQQQQYQQPLPGRIQPATAGAPAENTLLGAQPPAGYSTCGRSPWQQQQRVQPQCRGLGTLGGNLDSSLAIPDLDNPHLPTSMSGPGSEWLLNAHAQQHYPDQQQEASLPQLQGDLTAVAQGHQQGGTGVRPQLLLAGAAACGHGESVNSALIAADNSQPEQQHLATPPASVIKYTEDSSQLQCQGGDSSSSSTPVCDYGSQSLTGQVQQAQRLLGQLSHSGAGASHQLAADPLATPTAADSTAVIPGADAGKFCPLEQAGAAVSSSTTSRSYPGRATAETSQTLAAVVDPADMSAADAMEYSSQDAALQACHMTTEPACGPQLGPKASRRVSQAVNKYAARAVCRRVLRCLQGQLAAARQHGAAAEQQHKLGLMLRAVVGWKGVVQQEKDMLEGCCLRYSLTSWQMFLRYQQQKQQLTAAAVLHSKQQQAARCLQAWNSLVGCQQALQQLLQQVKQRQRHRILLAWRSAAARRAVNRDLVCKACLKHFHKVFISWRCQAAAATAEAKAVQGARNQYQRLLLRRCFKQWAWPVKGRALLTRVFATAEQAWNSRAREQHCHGDPGAVLVARFQLMQLALQCWLEFTAVQLQAAAAQAAEAAAAAFCRTKVTVRVWHSWQLVMEAAAEKRRLHALAVCCFGCWLKQVRVQKQNPHSIISMRRALQAHVGHCRTEQQWYSRKLQARTFSAWKAKVLCTPCWHYQQQLLLKALQGFQKAAHQTMLLLLPFWYKWQRQRLLQKSVVLWRGLVLLLQQQRSESAAVDSWRDSRVAAQVVASWQEFAAAAVAKRQLSLVAHQHYERAALHRMLLRWSVVICASSAVRVYSQQMVMHRVLLKWRRAVAAVRLTVAEAAASQHQMACLATAAQLHTEGQHQPLQEGKAVAGGKHGCAAACMHQQLPECGQHTHGRADRRCLGQYASSLGAEQQMGCAQLGVSNTMPVSGPGAATTTAAGSHMHPRVAPETRYGYPAYEVMVDCTNTVHQLRTMHGMQLAEVNSSTTSKRPLRQTPLAGMQHPQHTGQQSKAAAAAAAAVGSPCCGRRRAAAAVHCTAAPGAW